MSHNYNPNIHGRRSIRLKGYDYSQAGLYFITICCQDMICRFGEIQNDEMLLNDAGRLMETEWLALTTRFPNILLHEFQVMPNHFHGIIEIVETFGSAAVGAALVAAQSATTPKTIGDMMDAYKSIVTVEYINGVKELGWPRFDGKLLQRDYYEHIIRNEKSYQIISNYIINNPSNWKNDKFFRTS